MTIRLLMNYRTKFRIPFKCDVSTILNQFNLELEIFIDRISIDYNKPIDIIMSGNITFKVN